jgi:Tol biopolymer transport system component
MRIPLEGGQGEPIPGSAVRDGLYAHGNIALSPGGERLVYLAKVNTPGTRASQKAVIVKLDTGASTSPQLVDVDQRIAYPPQFSPDGKAIAYPIQEIGSGQNREDNLWLQPLDGSPRQRLTNFAPGNTRVFYWSPDGKTLGVLRSRVDSDTVVLRESVLPPQ